MTCPTNPHHLYPSLPLAYWQGLVSPFDGLCATYRKQFSPHVVYVVSWDYIFAMLTVGVRELKARLSECIRMVREGGEVYVTYRGRIAAEIRPPSRITESEARKGLRRRAQEGKVRLGAPNRPEIYDRRLPLLTGEEIQNLLSETRGDS